MLTNYLAEVWGISIVIVSLALLIKENYLKSIFNSIEDNANLFLWGLISLVIGISMVLSYNVWDKNWQVIITLFGWAALLKGLAILFFPELAKKWTRKMENSSFIPYALVIAVFIGLIITYLGFTA